MIYPYYAPIILTDTIFEAYGGDTAPYSTNQLSIGYWLAEQQMTQHLGAYLTPTLVSGTYPYDYPGQRLRLDHGEILLVNSVQYGYASCNCVITSSAGCAFIEDAKQGYLILDNGLWSMCTCFAGWPFNVTIVDTSGFSSGTVYQPDILLGLVLAAKIDLAELFDPFGLEGGAGDPGIQEWSDGSHRESRVKLGTNIFGNTPIANKIKKLTLRLANRPALKLGG